MSPSDPTPESTTTYYEVYVESNYDPDHELRMSFYFEDLNDALHFYGAWREIPGTSLSLDACDDPICKHIKPLLISKGGTPGIAYSTTNDTRQSHTAP